MTVLAQGSSIVCHVFTISQLEVVLDPKFLAEVAIPTIFKHDYRGMGMQNDVWFNVDNAGNFVFTMNGIVIGAVHETDFGVIPEHDDEVMRNFRNGIVALYTEVPVLEQVVADRLSKVNLTETRHGPISRFIRALVPLSNNDFQAGHFDQSRTEQAICQPPKKKKNCKCKKGMGNVIPFPRRSDG